MRAGAERSRAQWSRVAVSAQKDTKMASVAMCQGKQKWHVWNPAWREETVVWMRPQSEAHDRVSE